MRLPSYQIQYTMSDYSSKSPLGDLGANDGPQNRTIPAQTFKVCTGCKYLDKQPMLRGHRSVTDNYTCRHPDFKNETAVVSTIKRGRTIHYNHAGECTTPDWCPFLQPKNNTDGK